MMRKIANIRNPHLHYDNVGIRGSPIYLRTWPRIPTMKDTKSTGMYKLVSMRVSFWIVIDRESDEPPTCISNEPIFLFIPINHRVQRVQTPGKARFTQSMKDFSPTWTKIDIQSHLRVSISHVFPLQKEKGESENVIPVPVSEQQMTNVSTRMPRSL